MNKNTYLNVLATGIFLVMLLMSFVFVKALDQLRFSMEEMNRTVKNLESRIASLRALPAQTAAAVATGTSAAEAANRRYYDPNAESGGRLVTAFGADVGNMNMLITNDAYVSEIWAKTMDSLAERDYADDGSGELKPMLAESWTISPDRRKYRIKLRKGVLWHDFTDPVTGKEWKNREVTAHDFKFYLDVVKDETVDCAPLRGYLKDIEKIDVITDHEFEVIWSKPYFLAEDISLGLIPLPRHLYHAYDGPFDGRRFNDDHERNRMIVGCGPYRFDKWEKGRRIVLRRFDNYYGALLGIQPPIETISFDIIQHPNTRLQALLSKELDLDALSPDQWINRTDSAAFQPDGFLEKIEYPTGMYSYIGLNQNNPVFRDKKVRQALSHLVNREKILKDVFFNLAEMVSGPFPKTSAAYDQNVRPYAFDIEEAKKLLAEAGWKDSDGDGILDRDGKPFRFTLIYPNVSVTYQKMLPIIKEDMAKAGVQMELLGIEWSVLVQRLEKKQFDACSLAWTGTLKPDPYQLWHSSLAKVNASSNHIAFANPKADELIEKIRVSFDSAERNKLYHEFHRLIHEEEPYLFLFAPHSLVAVNKRYNNRRVFHDGLKTNILWVKRDQQMRVPGY